MKKNKVEINQTAHMVESIIGCKWSLHVIDQIRKGICRPGELERSAQNLSRKVLTERLNKLLRFKILEKKSFPIIPPKVEYSFTPFGRKFLKIVDAINKLEKELN